MLGLKISESIQFNCEKYIEDKKIREKIGSFINSDIEFRKFLLERMKFSDIILQRSGEKNKTTISPKESDILTNEIEKEFSIGFVKDLNFLISPLVSRGFFENHFHKNLNSIQREEEGYIVFSPKKEKNLIFLVSNYYITKGFFLKSVGNKIKNEFKKIGKNTIINLYKNVLCSFPVHILREDNKTKDEKFLEIFAFLLKKRKDLCFFTIIDLEKNERYIFMKLYCSISSRNYVSNIVDVENLLLKIDISDFILQNKNNQKLSGINFCYLREYENISTKESFYRDIKEIKIRKINIDQLPKEFNYYKIQRDYHFQGYFVPYYFENFKKFHLNIGFLNIENVQEITCSFQHRLISFYQKNLNLVTEYIYVVCLLDNNNEINAVKIKFDEYNNENRLGYVELELGKLRNHSELKILNDPKNKRDHRRSHHYGYYDIIRGYNNEGPYQFVFDIIVSPEKKSNIKLSLSRFQFRFISSFNERILNFYEFLEELMKRCGEKQFLIYVMKYAK